MDIWHRITGCIPPRASPPSIAAHNFNFLLFQELQSKIQQICNKKKSRRGKKRNRKRDKRNPGGQSRWLADYSLTARYSLGAKRNRKPFVQVNSQPGQIRARDSAMPAPVSCRCDAASRRSRALVPTAGLHLRASCLDATAS